MEVVRGDGARPLAGSGGQVRANVLLMYVCRLAFLAGVWESHVLAVAHERVKRGNTLVFDDIERRFACLPIKFSRTGAGTES